MYNFGLSSEQQELQSSLRRYLDGECALSQMRPILQTADRFAARHWRELAGLGFLGIGIPEAHGGSGLSATCLTAAMETLGRTLLPAPWLETLVVADLIASIGTDEQKERLLPDIGSGDCIATLAAAEPEGLWVPEAMQATVTRTGDRHVLNGTKLWVPHAHVADLILCPVRRVSDTGAPASLALIALKAKRLGGRITLLDGLDDACPGCELSLDGLVVTESDFIGAGTDVAAAWQRALQLATVLASAQLVGGMERGLDMLVSFSKERKQFGKAIGSYQALKHRCADLLIDLEIARGTLYYAAWALEAQTADLDIAVSSAKASISDAAVRAAEHSLQSFGAIGFTWEHDIHFYLKRAKRLQTTLGDAVHHRERIAALAF